MKLKNKLDSDSKFTSVNNSQMQPHFIKIFPKGLIRHSIFRNADLTGELERPSSSHSLLNQDETVYRMNSSFKSQGVSRQNSKEGDHAQRSQIPKNFNYAFAQVNRFENHSVDYIQRLAEQKVHRDTIAAEKHHGRKLKNIRGYKPENAKRDTRIQSVANYLKE